MTFQQKRLTSQIHLGTVSTIIRLGASLDRVPDREQTNVVLSESHQLSSQTQLRQSSRSIGGLVSILHTKNHASSIQLFVSLEKETHLNGENPQVSFLYWKALVFAGAARTSYWWKYPRPAHSINCPNLI